MRLLLLADMHVGSIKDIDYYCNTITQIINDEVILKHTDCVVILGDYFDRLFKVNEEYVSLAINIMSYLIRACRREKTKIRIVYGTESHEMNQYRLFNYHFTSSKVDIKLFTTCTEEELFPNVNVLYLPEEYIDDKHEFYKDTLYSGKKYEIIFGHGIIVEGMPMASKIVIASEKSEKQVPRFKTGELAEAGKFVAFGHYHIYTDLGSNVYYIGSLFRNCFGEETPKGYGVWEDGKFTFVENTRAYIYKTYEFDETSTVYSSADEILNEIDKIKTQNPDVFNGETTGRIRVVFHTPENVDPSFHENLKNIIFNDKLITPLIKESNHEIIKDAAEEAEDEYSFVLDNSMDITNKIYTFISKQYDTPISLEKIERYIKDPLMI